jgi:plastocyanin
MSTSILRRWFPILGAAILLAVLIAGCTGSPYGPTPTTTQVTTAPTPAATTLATTVKTTAPTPQITATILNQTNVAITIKEFAFSPKFITVSKGTTVTWTNQDPTPHQIINDPGGTGGMSGLGQIFKSNSLGMGESYSFTFNTTGMFPYHCSIHPSMEGKVTVI